jgi:stress response protein YsnF
MAHRNRTRILADEEVVPVVEETALVYKERVVTEKVRLHKRVHEDEEVLDIPVQAEAIEVERVPVGRWLDAPAEVRREGDTTVYPVVEEVRVTRRQETRRVQERVALRREEVVVERDAAAPRDADRDPNP